MKYKGLAADQTNSPALLKFNKRSHQPNGRGHTHTHVLFSGVGELVLSAAVVGLLDPWVGPQAFDGYHVRLVEAADLLNVHLLHQHGVILRGHRDGDTAVSWWTGGANIPRLNVHKKAAVA